MIHTYTTRDGDVITVELGVANNPNVEHLGNARISVNNTVHIRGIMVYKKDESIVLRLPSYKTKQSEIAFVELSSDVVKAVIGAVKSVPKDEYVQHYTGGHKWGIWARSRDIPQEEPAFVDEEDMTP